MDQKQIEQAAALFVAVRQGGAKIRDLPESCRPSNVAETNVIIREVTRQLNKPIGGWKITFVFRPRQGAVIAPLFAENLFDSPARVPSSITHSLLIEPEVAFRMRHDLPPRAKVYRVEEVAEAVAACPALELNDTRFDTGYRTIRQILDGRESIFEAHADHQTSGAFVTGTPVEHWRDVDYATLNAVMRQGDKVLVDTIGGHALGDPFLPVVALANALRHDEGLKQDQVVATGSYSGFFPVSSDIPVRVAFEGFGSAEATFVS